MKEKLASEGMGDVMVVLPDAPPLDTCDRGENKSHSEKSLVTNMEETAVAFSMTASCSSSEESKIEVKKTEGNKSVNVAEVDNECLTATSAGKRRSPTPTSSLGEGLVYVFRIYCSANKLRI